MSPSRSPRVCNKPGCGKPTQGRYCDRHAGEAKARERERDRAAGPRGYDSQRWRKYRKWFLNQPENRLCACGCGRLSQEVHHIEPTSDPGDPQFWDTKNHSALTKACHSRVTMTELRKEQSGG